MPEPFGRGDRLTGLKVFGRYFLRPAIGLVIVVACLLALWIVVGSILARRFTVRAQAACPPGEPSLDDLASRFPATRVNASALRLEELAASLGIDAATGEKKGRARPAETSKQEFQKVKDALSAHLMNQVRRADDRQTQPPEDVAAYRERFHQSIEAIEQHVLLSELPVWEREPEHPLDSPIPNLLGQLNLQKIITLDVLEKLRLERPAAALVALEASWKLNQSIWHRSELICQLIAIVADRWQHRALRVLGDAPVEWEQRIASYDTRSWLFTSLRMETWLMTEGFRRQPEQALGKAAGGPVGLILRPYLEMGMADYAEHKERVVTELEALGPCTFDVETFRRVWNQKPKKWNIPGRVSWPELHDATRRMLRRRLDQELTVLILQLRRGTDLPNPVPSKVCARDSWAYRRSAAGRLEEVVFSRRIPEPINDKTWELPLRFVSPGRKGA